MHGIEKLNLNDPETQSADVVAENIDALRSLFPEAFEEGKIDFEVLKQLLGGAVDERDEKYGLNWHGKRKARQIALTPSTGTLLPCPDESVDWDTTQNLVIEGDNLEVLKLLQKSYAGKVKLIYIDPPYNTGKEFIYPDRFQDNLDTYLKYTGQKGEDGLKTTSNTENDGRFHTNWLNMIYPRLKLARTMLADDGAIFISIDDNEKANLKEICDEIFGEDNFLTAIIVQSNKRGQTYKEIAKCHEYILVYYKTENGALGELDKDGDALPYADEHGGYDLWELRNRNPKFGRHNRPNLYFPIYVNPNSVGANGLASISLTKSDEYCREALPKNSEGADSCWRWSSKKVQTDGIDATPITVFAKQRRDGEWNIYEKSRKSTTKAKSIWSDTAVISEQGTVEAGKLGMSGVLDFPKPIELIRRCVFLGTNEDDLVMDFFAGSGTTAHAVMLQSAQDGLSRRWISVQLPEPTYEYKDGEKVAKPQNKIAFENGHETIADICKERIRRSANKLKEEYPGNNADLGFRVFKLAQSNIRAWEPEPSDIEGTLLANAEHLAQGRSEQDVLHELLLKLGLDLCVPIEKKQIAGKAVHSIGGGALIVCLADGLTKDVVEALANGIVAWRKALAPAVDTRVVFKDSGFADDVAKTNMAAILNQNGILDVRSL
ncbi:DNA methylase N-4/N-6 [Nitrobacter hamburgensis X14]|uniref:site-specific DNA-methyltransferase (adenine-specific) n=1 Tax=Nitrobacter hamburgensis (strain DSM 10229 / NCIMB 13809 / X14) TaxID=323097 RepID=Q1QQM5_NITHX|nr:site-specific DNA-methyltransferase [Nitrobacter hamburgensis]ABE61472.1 DNA methylase N-4/N-6 [Nitrobacter hamburgensis X14]